MVQNDNIWVLQIIYIYHNVGCYDTSLFHCSSWKKKTLLPVHAFDLIVKPTVIEISLILTCLYPFFSIESASRNKYSAIIGKKIYWYSLINCHTVFRVGIHVFFLCFIFYSKISFQKSIRCQNHSSQPYCSGQNDLHEHLFLDQCEIKVLITPSIWTPKIYNLLHHKFDKITTRKWFSTGTLKTINFPFVPNGKVLVFRCPSK